MRFNKVIIISVLVWFSPQYTVIHLDIILNTVCVSGELVITSYWKLNMVMFMSACKDIFIIYFWVNNCQIYDVEIMKNK